VRGESVAPTMFVPAGTEIASDGHGLLSIRTPGNLVLQNSGNYATIESTRGSIRIEPQAQIEAVNVRCAEACFVRGSLTAWKVTAKSIHVEDSARAHIVLQETGHLQIGREARVVGNFSSEKELFLLFSRFADQFRGLPMAFDRPGAAQRLGEGPRPYGEGAEVIDYEPPEVDAPEPLPEALGFALLMLERDGKHQAYTPAARRALDQVATLLREHDLETLRATHRTLFARVPEPSDDARRARQLIAEHYENA
jgi:hypothetical protein